MVDEELRRKVHQVCADYVGGIWKTIRAEDILIEHLTSGFLNFVLKLSLPPYCKPLDNEPSKLIMKNALDKLKRGPYHTMIENIIVVLLASKGIAPKVYGIFEGGRLDEYIESRLLKPQELHKPEIIESVARTLARIHSLTPPISKYRDKRLKYIDDIIINNILNDPRNNLKEDTKRQALIKMLSEIDIRKENVWLTQTLSASTSPVIFCHGDLLLTNILYCNNYTTCAIKLVDYEMSGYHNRGVDFGSFFRSFCFDYSYPDPPYFKVNLQDFPTIEEQKNFFKIYCKELELQTGKKIDYEKEEKYLLEEYKIFTLQWHFGMVVFGLKTPDKYQGKMEMLDYSMINLEAYLAQKKEFFG